MLRKITITFFCSMLMISMAACAGDSGTNGSANTSDPKNLPEGIRTKPIQPDGKTTPGIPDPKTVDVNKMPKGTTPTPGIPDPKTIGKTPLPKGTSTPGIPSPEELKRQKERKIDPNEVNRPSKTTGETTSPIDRQRKVKQN